ncbi:MAG: IS1 family transposase [Candidatus Binataceae bacterium]
MNMLSIDPQVQIISALVEGNSIRSVERMTCIHRDTIMRLAVRVGEGCDRLMDEMLRGLTCPRLQLDEIWAYVGMKQKTARRMDKADEFGDLYTFVAIDVDSKLVPCWHVGKRTWHDTALFINDLRDRVANRPQITTDVFRGYYGAIATAFNRNVDYAQIVKVFASETNEGRERYSPPVMLKCEREEIIGRPDPDHISTSYVERQNLTMRMQVRRFTRLTNGFSKKRTNHAAAVALHFAHYNLVRVHRTLRCTPAMAAGVTDRLWSVENLLEEANYAAGQPDIIALDRGYFHLGRLSATPRHCGMNS